MKIYAILAKHGGGKGFLLNETCKAFPNLKRVPLLRTRPIRRDEKNTIQTPFCTKSEFDKMVKKGEMLVVEEFPTNGEMHYYGIRKDSFKQNADYVLELSPLGLEQLKLVFPDVVIIFIYCVPFTREERYVKRGGVYTKAEFDDREERDRVQFNNLKFDYFVMNSELDNFGAMKAIRKIIGGK